MSKIHLAIVFIGLQLIVSCQKNEPVSPTPQDKKYYSTDEFVMGADLSYVNAMKDNNAIYRINNKVKDPYEVFKEIGTNVVRLRLWVDPSWQSSLYGDIRYSDFADVKKAIKSAKDAGMAVSLDLHYSDIWADPSHQETPNRWKSLPFAKLVDSVYSYTANVLTNLASENLTPEYIQIGNETNNGMMLPQGAINVEDFSKFGALIKSGVKAVRDFSEQSLIKPKIILHIAQFTTIDYWLNGIINKEQINDFDIIGISHYYKWSNIHQFSLLTESISKLKQQYGKDIMIVETAFPWTNSSKDFYGNILNSEGNNTGYQVTKEGQRDYMKGLVKAVMDGGGKGVFYWEPAWVSTPSFKDSWGTGSSWENNAFFDFDGNILPVTEYMTAKY